MAPELLYPESRRVNIGCGWDHRDGYLNVDFLEVHKPDLVADARDLSTLPDDYFEEVLANDVLEHLERKDTAPALDEWFRILRPGGRVHVRLPDLLGVARLVQERDTVEDHQQQIHSLFGTQGYAGDYHLAGFTDLTLVAALTAAGFTDIRIHRVDRWMLDAWATKPEGTGANTPAIGYGVGIYEPDSDADPTCWCEREVEVLIMNPGSEPQQVRVELELSHPVTRRAPSIEISAAGRTEVVRKVGEAPHVWSRTFDLDPGPLRLRLVSTGEQVVAPGDPRDMFFRLHGARAVAV